MDTIILSVLELVSVIYVMYIVISLIIIALQIFSIQGVKSENQWVYAPYEH